MIFPVLYLVVFLLLYEHVRVRIMAFVFVFSGSCSQETSMWYHMIRYIVLVIFGGHSTQTDCRSCSVDPKMNHAAKRSLAMCEYTGGFLRDLIVVIHRDICREHSLIGRRNCLMTEAANSLSAAARRELSTTSPIANLASDSATAGLAWVRVCVLWRPGASVRRTQAER